MWKLQVSRSKEQYLISSDAGNLNKVTCTLLSALTMLKRYLCWVCGLTTSNRWSVLMNRLWSTGDQQVHYIVSGVAIWSSLLDGTSYMAA
jgi:hypothetical protein